MRYLGTYLFIFFLVLVAAGTGYNYFYHPLENWSIAPSPTPTPIVAAPTPTPESDAEIRTKILQLVSVPLNLSASNSSMSAELDWISANNPGFVTLFGSQIASTTAELTISAIKQPRVQAEKYPYAQRADLSDQDLNTLTPLVAVDHEGGSVQRLNGLGFTKLASWQKLCGLDTDIRKDQLGNSANELAIVGVDIVFAPMLDLAPANSILKDRVCSDDREVIREAAMDFATVFYSYGLMPVFKHFPGIGTAKTDLHTASSSAFISYDQVVVFRQLLDAYPYAGVMTAHVAVENQFSAVPCSLSRDCIDQLQVTYPEVVIFTDALDMESALVSVDADQFDYTKRLSKVSSQALLAGNTVLVYGPGVTPTMLSEIVAELTEQYKSSKELSQQVNVNITKVLELKTGHKHE